MLKRLFLAMVLALAAVPAAAQLFGQPELLEPEKAFRISARPLDERSIEVEFRIADGYYMYRRRLSWMPGSS
jgi:thioredoxin:protein disulfide reductase